MANSPPPPIGEILQHVGTSHPRPDLFPPGNGGKYVEFVVPGKGTALVIIYPNARPPIAAKLVNWSPVKIASPPATAASGAAVSGKDDKPNEAKKEKPEPAGSGTFKGDDGKVHSFDLVKLDGRVYMVPPNSEGKGADWVKGNTWRSFGSSSEAYAWAKSITAENTKPATTTEKPTPPQVAAHQPNSVTVDDSVTIKNNGKTKNVAVVSIGAGKFEVRENGKLLAAGNASEIKDWLKDHDAKGFKYANTGSSESDDSNKSEVVYTATLHEQGKDKSYLVVDVVKSASGTYTVKDRNGNILYSGSRSEVEQWLNDQRFTPGTDDKQEKHDPAGVISYSEWSEWKTLDDGRKYRNRQKKVDGKWVTTEEQIEPAPTMPGGGEPSGGSPPLDGQPDEPTTPKPKPAETPAVPVNIDDNELATAPPDQQDRIKKRHAPAYTGRGAVVDVDYLANGDTVTTTASGARVQSHRNPVTGKVNNWLIGGPTGEGSTASTTPHKPGDVVAPATEASQPKYDYPQVDYTTDIRDKAEILGDQPVVSPPQEVASTYVPNDQPDPAIQTALNAQKKLPLAENVPLDPAIQSAMNNRPTAAARKGVLNRSSWVSGATADQIAASVEKHRPAQVSISKATAEAAQLPGADSVDKHYAVTDPFAGSNPNEIFKPAPDNPTEIIPAAPGENVTPGSAQMY